jgi:hypothetical protein
LRLMRLEAVAAAAVHVDSVALHFVEPLNVILRLP